MISTLPSAPPALEHLAGSTPVAHGGFDETLLYDPARYTAHKEKQLHRPPPVSAAGALALPAVDSWQPPDALRHRRSHRRFALEPIPATTFSRALTAFRHDRHGAEVKTLYPSTGGLYGLDVYVHVKAGRVDQVPGGIYFYHPATHRLLPVAPESALARDIHHHQNRPIFAASAFTLLFVFDAGVTAPVYGPSSHFLACIEAGLALATFNHLAETLGLGLCPVGLFDFPRLHAALGLPAGHQVLHLAECGTKLPPPRPADAAPPPAPVPAPAAAPAAEPAPPTDLTVAGLRRFLASSLPEYMVPSHFVLVDEIPLTPNNKIDREALLKLADHGALALGTEFVATASEIEAKLEAIWRQVIRVDRIGAEDNFFDLGGDSMGVAEVRRHIAEQWKLDIPILKLFQFPTIRATARFLLSQLETPPADRAVAPAGDPAAGGCCATPAAPSAAPVPSPAPADADLQALAWVRAHPSDPRAAAVAARLRQRGLHP
jgi:SagB-type dehydrogenase family enzyme